MGCLGFLQHVAAETGEDGSAIANAKTGVACLACVGKAKGLTGGPSVGEREVLEIEKGFDVPVGRQSRCVMVWLVHRR